MTINPLTPRQRERFAPRLDRALRTISRPLLRVGVLDSPWYASYELHEAEHIATIAQPVERVVDELESMGYEASTLAALKLHPEYGVADAGSYRRVSTHNPHWQWHVHVFDVARDATDVFSHYEYRPDVRPLGDETLCEAAYRLREHYRPTWNTSAPDDEATYYLGEACERLYDYIRDEFGIQSPGPGGY